jgi:hypothetical protein
MTTLRVMLVVLLSGCVVSTGRSRTEPVDPLEACLEECGGCCDESGLCRSGSSVSACGGRGTVCSACTDGEICRLYECRAEPAPSAPAGPPQPGDLTVRWRFSGQACAVVRDVAFVSLDVPGLSLPNGGVFACSSGAADGVTLPAVPAGFYRFTARGLTSAGQLLYEDEGFVTVNGPVLKRLDLAPVATATGRAVVSWRLPASSCAAAGVTEIAVQVADRAPVLARCDQTGVELPGLLTGLQDVSLVAVDAHRILRASSRGRVQVLAGATVSAEFSLTWMVGGLAVRWSLSNMGLWQTCTQAGANEVVLNLRGADGRFLYPGAGVPVSCEASGAVFESLPSGLYEVFGQAVGAFGTLYRSNAVLLEVHTGVFPTVSAQTPALVLER